MFPADAVFSHCRFVWLSQTNVPVVLLDPGINRTASLINVNLTTLARYAVDTRVFSPRLSFTGRRKLSIFFGGGPTDLMLCHDWPPRYWTHINLDPFVLGLLIPDDGGNTHL
jgi:hypothetical protein